MYRLVLCLVLILIGGFNASPLWAQISAGGTPPSFTQSLTAAVPTITMPPVDVAALRAEDEQLPKEERNRFAAPIEVLYNLNNSGSWATLPNGDRLWRLRISSPGAYSLGLLYNHWQIPKGGLLWLYNDDHSVVIGAFTSFNNWTDGTNITQPVSGDAVTLEYLEPASIRGQSVLSISRVCHAYRKLFAPQNAAENFGDSGPCNVNINCPAGAPLLNYKHGVAMIVSGGFRWCTGSLINDVPADGTPYFLTANHCLDGSEGSWVFIFNYESAACFPNTDGPTNQSVANASLLANNTASDFALLRLSSVLPTVYLPFYNGWDNRDLTWVQSYNISHPSGDVKKLAIDNDGIISSTWSGTPANSHWQVGAYETGMTEGGSSGSPLLDLNFHISGQLHGGPSSCSNPTGSDYYGKFSMSWNYGGTPSTEVKDWLDPNNSGTQIVNGMFINPPNNDICAGAYSITALPYTNFGNTNFANNDYPHAVFGTSPDVVYNLFLPCSTQVTASLCGSFYDTAIEIRTGGTCPGSTLVAYNDDFCGLQSQVTFNVRAGVPYWILVYGYAQHSGLFTLNVTQNTTYPPTNDACPGSKLISSLPYNDVGGTTCAAADLNSCVTTITPDVVYTLNVPTCQTVTVSLCGSDFDTQLSIRAGGTCPGTYLAACNDDNYCSGVFTLQSTATFVAQANTNYYIIVGGYNAATGTYILNATGTPFTPPNDVCPGTTIATLPYSDFGNTGCATHNYSVACRTTTSPDVVYNFTPTVCETLTVSLCGSGYDCLIDARTGGSCPGSVSVACNDDNSAACGSGSLQSQITFAAYAGITYYFVVSGFNGFAGPFVINVYGGATFTPSNDVCPGTAIASLPFTDISSTACDAHNYPNGLGNGSPDAVYSFTSGTCQYVTVTLCGSYYDTGISVYKNGACPGTTLVAFNDDNQCAGAPPYNLQSTLAFQATATVPYYILIHGYGLAAGGYILNVTGAACSGVAAVDSLVIHPSGPNIDLTWKWQGPTNWFYIYRGLTPGFAITPANRIDSTTNDYYTDFNPIASSNIYFYAVTAASLHTLLEENGGVVDNNPVVDKATASPTSEPFFAADPYPQTSEPDVDKKAAAPIEPVYLPAYDQLNTHYVPNPNKAKPVK